MSRFVFCFPYRGVGGVPVLFSRLARRLLAQGHEASVIDFPDGAMAEALTGSGVELLSYGDDPVHVSNDQIVVFQSLNPWAMYRQISFAPLSRMFFWNCHPFNLVPTLPGLRTPMMAHPAFGRLILKSALRRYRNDVVRFIRFLEQRHALAFMDLANVENTQTYLDIVLRDPDYLPVFAGDAMANTVSARGTSAESLRLAWIGRVSDFKYPILKATLLRLNRDAHLISRKLEFRVVGTGEYLEDLRRDVAGLENVRVTFAGDLTLEELQMELRDSTDILFAMGASALEGARLGVPTVLLDVSYGDVPEGYVFTLLHERRGFTLGEVLASKHVRRGNQSLKEILQLAIDDFSALSVRSSEYYRANHSPDAITSQFVRLASSSACFYNEFHSEGFSKPDPTYEIFSKLRAVLRIR